MNSQLIIIEDDIGEQFLLKKILSENFHYLPYEIASNATEGFMKIVNSPYNTKVVLLDLNLPGESGFDLLIKIKQSALISHIPVIIYTHSTNPQDIIQSYKLGGNSYVNKPIGLKETKETMKKIVEYWIQLNQQGPK